MGNNRLVMIGLVVAVLGGLAIAIPAFTTTENKDLAHVGDVKLTAKEETTHVIPPYVGPIAIGVGIILMGAGILIRR